MPAFRDITGRTFANWQVIRYLGHQRWLCCCLTCNQKYAVIAWNVASGHSSGCNNCRRKRVFKHGESPGTGRKGSRTYNVWQGMWRRCDYPKHIGYKYYGGRGIKVCRRWRDYRKFIADMGYQPKGKSIDRIDNQGNYTPHNCRWATPREQAQNKPTNRLVKCRGEYIPLTEAERRLHRYFYGVLQRAGWPDVDVATLPNPIPPNFLKRCS